MVITSTSRSTSMRQWGPCGLARALRAVSLGLWACGIAWGGTASPAKAEDAEAAFFKGKTVRLIVGYASGGGYDVYARMLTPYLAKALDATVVVQNQPGAGGMTALDRLYASPPDGLQMMLVNGTAASMAQLMGESAARYDLGKLGYLGLVSASPYVWLVTPESPIKTPADAVKLGQTLRWSSTGPMDGLSDGAAFTCEALKLDCRVILGYPSSNEAAIAVAKGEMDAIYVSDTSANNYARSGSDRGVATMARKRSRFFPDLPTIFEGVQLTPDQQWWFDFRSNVDNLGRILVVPPGMAPARLAFLQAAAKTALTDPALVAEGEKTQRYIDYQDPETTRKMAVSVVTELTAEQKQNIRTVVNKRK
jgi:tripartite-type tricarboxylate transporter receptor subunit TctC